MNKDENSEEFYYFFATTHQINMSFVHFEIVTAKQILSALLRNRKNKQNKYFSFFVVGNE